MSENSVHSFARRDDEGSKLDIFDSLYNHLVMKESTSTQSKPNLDAVFSALADPTRRSILARLANGEACVKELALPYDISQPAISKHLKVLEGAGLVDRDQVKQRRFARLNAAPMIEAVRWLEDFRQFWMSNFDQLDDLLEELKKAELKDKEHE